MGRYPLLVFVFFLNALVTECCLVTNNTQGKWIDWPQEPVIRKRAEELIRKAGYVCTLHNVKTEDGYWLQMHNIPRRKGEPASVKKPVVLLHHGMLCSSAAWVAPGTENGLGFVLADAGYDVWLLNARGNTYSRNHESLSYKNDAARFWNFSFHEIGYYDIPAQLDYVLEATGHSQVYYLGYSMGSTGFYVMGSTRPEYNKKVKAMFSLAPIAYLEHVKSKLVWFLKHIEPAITPSLKAFSIYNILPQNRPCDLLNKYICSHPKYYRFCEITVEMISGYDHAQYNYSVVSIFLEHFPAGTSWKVFQHYFQLMSDSPFRQYDYGWVGNIKHYGSSIPPVYNLKNIDVPVVLVQGKNDYLSVNEDVDQLFQQLPNAKKMIIEYDKFTHADFMWAKDLKTLVYDNVVKLLNRFEHEGQLSTDTQLFEENNRL